MTVQDSSTPLTPEEAARFVNGDTTWPPGWHVNAEWSEAGSLYGSNGIYSGLRVTLVKESRNSSNPDANGKYSEPWTLRFPLGVPDFAMKDKDALVFWILEKVTWTEEHEIREFTRYRKDGRWYAPFHPHRGNYPDQHQTPEWQAQYRDPADIYVAGRMPGK